MKEAWPRNWPLNGTIQHDYPPWPATQPGHATTDQAGRRREIRISTAANVFANVVFNGIPPTRVSPRCALTTLTNEGQDVVAAPHFLLRFALTWRDTTDTYRPLFGRRWASPRRNGTHSTG